MATATPYVAEVRGKTPAAAAVVVRQALGRPNVYFYGQLFHTPEVQAMASHESTAAVFQALKIFTYGVLDDMKGASLKTREEMTPNMVAKLKRLTLVSLAHRHRRLGYDALFSALDVTDGRDLEDLIIDAITEGLLSGRMDQRNRTLEVAYAAARDVQLSDLSGLKLALESWSARCTRASDDLRKLAESSSGRITLEEMLTQELSNQETSVSDECKKDIIQMGWKADDDDWAPDVGRGTRQGRRGF